MSYYLYDHPNPNAPVRTNGIRFFGYPLRSKPIRYIVIHTPETLFNPNPPDRTGEAVANYFATSSRSASAHVMIDSDSTIPLLPPEAVAFHVRDYNTEGYGMECGWSYLDWGNSPEHDAKVIEAMARHIVSDPVLAALPTRRLSKSDVDAGLAGYVSHATLDPTRRKDPGTSFPWERLFARVNELKGSDPMTWTKPGDPINNLADADAALYSQGSIAGATNREASYNPGSDAEANDRTWITLARIVDMLMQFDIRMNADKAELNAAIASLETSAPLAAVWDAIALRSITGHIHKVNVTVT
jgi:hypothetical protein